MPYLIGKEYDSFDSLPTEDRVVILRRELDGLAETNLRWLKRNPWCPPLYKWAPTYKIKPRPYVPGLNNQVDLWQDIPSMMRRSQEGHGVDCKDVASARVAELYLAKFLCGFYIKVQQLGDLIVYHIQVEGYNRAGKFCREDPSKFLGMPEILTTADLNALMTG